MDRKENPGTAPLECGPCQEKMQEYLDGTLDKTSGLSVFLHMRDCADCQAEHDRLVGLFQLLEGLPDHEPPAEFDQKILASVNYEGYKAMEGIRRERVPVFLEEEFLPAFVRAPATRTAGLVVAVAAAGAQFALEAPAYLGAAVVVGVMPELMVRLQAVGRRVALGMTRARDTGS